MTEALAHIDVRVVHPVLNAQSTVPFRPAHRAGILPNMLPRRLIFICLLDVVGITSLALPMPFRVL